MRILKRTSANVMRSRSWCRRCSPSTTWARWRSRIAVPAAAGAAPRAEPHGGLLFGLLNAGCRAVGAVAVPRASCVRNARARAGLRVPPWRRWAWPSPAPTGSPRWAEDRFYGDAHRLRREQRLPARRRHLGRGRCAAVPQRQPAVPLARRIPLSRGAGAPGDGRARRAQAVLVLGGGDGMAVREVLKYDSGRGASRWSSSTRT
jgi:hypothetical protein